MYGASTCKGDDRDPSGTGPVRQEAAPSDRTAESWVLTNEDREHIRNRFRMRYGRLWISLYPDGGDRAQELVQAAVLYAAEFLGGPAKENVEDYQNTCQRF